MNTTQSAKVIDVLNDLLETCKDGEFGFRASAERAKSTSLRSHLLANSAECATAAGQLRTHIVQLGGNPKESGTVSGAVHRGWVALKTRLTSHSDLAVLDACERAEDTALSNYRDALKETLPQPIRSLIDHQYEGVKRNHDKIRRLRNGVRDALHATQENTAPRH